MRRDAYKVFSQARIADLTVKNRLIRSATYESLMTTEGRVTPELLTLYRGLADGGIGTIITGAMAVARQGKGYEHQICIYDDSFIPDIAQLAEVVHASGSGCMILAQLFHAGRQVLESATVAEPVGPSVVHSPVLRKQARELTVEEIESIVDCFVHAIARVKTAGYDGVQLHAAHGYLLSSFLSPFTNRRHDRYGGSIENRVTIVREIVARARERVGDFPILIKMNCTDHMLGGIDTETFPETAGQVAALGVDAIEVSGGMWDCLDRSETELGFLPVPIPESRTRINSPEKQSYFVPDAERLSVGVPVIVVGGHRNIEHLEEILNRGKIDFLALSRPLICEPDLPARWLEGRGREVADCVSCNSCVVEVGSKPVKCVLKQNRLKQRIVKNVAPRTWRLIFK
jgi:2,4-dienoyl-CoA reductase-like NADH-dependent reductase (Old Yellow Enzyme family)